MKRWGGDFIWRKIDQYVEEFHLIERGDRILLGLSGGADSILLARYLLHLREQGSISLYALHLNHMLRGEEAFRDQRFVEDFCRCWKIPLKICQQDVAAYASKKKESLEEAGREIRMAAMEEYAKETDCQKIALAHHQNDLVETMIFRMVRGTGPQGLTGIQPRNGKRIRPLLSVDKEEILWILSQLEQSFVEDSSNGEVDYSRNHIRHLVVPQLCKINEQALSHMAQLARQLEEENTFVRKQMDQIYEKGILRTEGIGPLRYPLSTLKDYDPFTRKEIIRRMTFEACGKKKDISFVHVDMVGKLLEKTPGKWCNLPYECIAMLEQDMLYMGARPDKRIISRDLHYFISRDEIEANGIMDLDLEEEGQISLELITDKPCEIRKKDCVKCFDYDKITSGISIRRRREGDYFIMDASGRRKTLKRYFIDEKIPADCRDRIYLLAEEHHILWITGRRMSEAYKITDSTRRILRVTYHGPSS